jgi:2-methylcitrate dehydratase PrpD
VKLPLRDAAIMNGALVHGLDFDDTHMKAVVHATAVSLPAARSASISGMVRNVSAAAPATAPIA